MQNLKQKAGSNTQKCWTAGAKDGRWQVWYREYANKGQLVDNLELSLYYPAQAEALRKRGLAV